MADRTFQLRSAYKLFSNGLENVKCITELIKDFIASSTASCGIFIESGILKQ